MRCVSVSKLLTQSRGCLAYRHAAQYGGPTRQLTAVVAGANVTPAMGDSCSTVAGYRLASAPPTEPHHDDSPAAADDFVRSESFAVEHSAAALEDELTRLFGQAQETETSVLSSTAPVTSPLQSPQHAPSVTCAPVSRPLSSEHVPQPRRTTSERVPCDTATVRPLHVERILTCGRWGRVMFQRYREASSRDGYVRAVESTLTNCLRTVSSGESSESLSVLREAFAQFHSDALLALIECALRCCECCAEASAVPRLRTLLGLLWESLSSPEGGRSFELPSKQVAWVAHLFELTRSVCTGHSGPSALPTSTLYHVVYVNRLTLRRRQNILCLRALLQFPPDPKNTQPGQETHEQALYSACVSHCVFRCIADNGYSQSGQVDGYAVHYVLQEALSVAWRSIDERVRQAALKSMQIRLRKASSQQGGRAKLMPHYLRGSAQNLERTRAAAVFDAMNAAATESNGFAVAPLDHTLLRCRVRRARGPSPLCQSWRDESPGDRCGNSAGLQMALSVLRADQPLVNDKLCSLYLNAIATIHVAVCETMSLSELLACVQPVCSHVPALSTLLLLRLVAVVAGTPGGDTDTESPALLRSAVAAVYQLIVHADVAEFAVTFLLAPNFFGSCSTVQARTARELFRCAVMRCLSYHVPQALLPVVCSRVWRIREVAVYQLQPSAIQAVTDLVDALPVESLTPEDRETGELLAGDEARRELFTQRTIPAGIAASSHAAQAATEESSVSARLLRALGESFASRGESGGGTPASPITARAMTSSLQTSASTLTALTAVFGYSTADLRTVMKPDVLRSCKAALASLYHVHMLFRYVRYDVFVVQQSAATQFTALPLSTSAQQLVQWSEDGPVSDSQALEQWLSQSTAPSLHSPPAFSETFTYLMVAQHTSCLQDAPPLPPTAGNLARRTYVEQLVTQASWKCLCYHLNAMIAEQMREKPEPSFTEKTWTALLQQLSLRDATAPFVSLFFSDPQRPAGEACTGRPDRTVSPLLLLALLADYQRYLQTSPAIANREVSALQQWAHIAMLRCFLLMVSRAEGQSSVALTDRVRAYRLLLTLPPDLDRSAGEYAQTHGRGKDTSASSQVTRSTSGSSSTRSTTHAFPPRTLRAPSRLHVEFLQEVCNSESLWTEAAPLLSLAHAARARISPVPAAAYDVVRRTCLQHQVSIPAVVQAALSRTP